MAEPLTITITDLRAGVDRALRLVHDLLGEDVAVPVDYYWHLPVDEAFDLTASPSDFTVGKVSDDVESILSSHDRGLEEAWHELSHLIGVLRALELMARS